VRRIAAALATVVALGALSPALTSAGAATPRANLPDIENDVMCPSCREPLAVAQSPQAYAERNFIRGLIARGLTKGQIERQLVAQYGPSVLGRPPAHGFNLTVYVLPPAIVLLGLGILALTLPRWRRRAQAAKAAQAAAPAPSPSATDSERLDEDLAAFGD
jgi:cytochrome c-type biogenesis protein CcmH